MKKILILSFLFMCFISINSHHANACGNIDSIKIDGVKTTYKIQGKHGEMYSASQPNQSSFKEIKDLKVKTVLNLRSPEEIDFNEKKIVEDQGMKYINLPVSSAQLDDKKLHKKFSKILSKSKNYPLFIHCSSANRVATMLAIHHILDHGESYESAVHRAENFGLTKSFLKEKIKEVTQK